eukprot:5680899-Amphidinium_carterae.3
MSRSRVEQVGGILAHCKQRHCSACVQIDMMIGEVTYHIIEWIAMENGGGCSETTLHYLQYPEHARCEVALGCLECATATVHRFAERVLFGCEMVCGSQRIGDSTIDNSDEVSGSRVGQRVGMQLCAYLREYARLFLLDSVAP